jgi:hypothetical protein
MFALDMAMLNRKKKILKILVDSFLSPSNIGFLGSKYTSTYE